MIAGVALDLTFNVSREDSEEVFKSSIESKLHLAEAQRK